MKPEHPSVQRPMSRMSGRPMQALAPLLPLYVPLTLGTLLTLGGCDRDATSTAPTATTAALSAASASPSTSAAAAPTSHAEPITAAAVQELVKRWAEAQNKGDLDAYAALYANPFEGIKRSGPRTARFSRKGWLDDRATMFKKKMEVKISDLQISTSQSAARAVFTQRWSSDSYSDEGRKSLVLVHDNGVLKLAREEMLSSTILGAAPGNGGGGPVKSAALVIHAGAPYLVLHSHKLDESWLSGPPVRANMRRVVTVRAPLDEAKLPAAVKAWRGKKVRLMNAAGSACEGTIDAFAAIGRMVPHFGSRATWSGRNGQPPMPPAAIAKDAWGMASKRVAARVKPAAGATCAGALWAHEATAAAPKATLPGRAKPALDKKAAEAFRALPSYAQLQQEYTKSFGGEQPWEKHGGGKLVIRSWQLGSTRFVSVNGRAVPLGCDSFQGQLMGLWQVDGSPAAPELKLTTTGEMKLLSATEIDGKPTFVFDGFYQRGLLQRDSDKATITQALRIPFLDCEC